MPVDHNEPTPLYRQLAASLRADITAGKLEGRLASIRDMAADYELAEVTVRKALDILREEGLITSVPGRGTFVVR
jgi:GntR family transcriptional regulator